MKKILALSALLFVFTFVPFSQAHAQALPGVYNAGPVGKIMLQAESGPQAGMVTLKWTQEGANTINYNVMYGTTPGTDLYGALNIGRANPEIGNQNRYTVKSLTPGVTYYFRLVSIHTDGSNGGPSLYVKATAASGVTAGTFFTGPVGRSQLIATPGPASGQVTLTWQNFWGDATNYHVVYGLTPGAFQWGALNVGKNPVNSYTVGYLTPGTTYYFSIVPVRGGVAAYTGISVAATAK